MKSTNDFDMQMAKVYRQRMEEKRKEKLSSENQDEYGKDNLI